MNKNQSIELLENKLQNLIKEKIPYQFARSPGRSVDRDQEELSHVQLFLQPLTDIHLHSDYLNEIEANSSIYYVYMFSIIAVFILIIACINFTNLSTAHSVKRAREVGVRKVLGSRQSQLILQFLTEAMLLCSLSVIISLFLIKLFLPYFNNFVGKELELSVIGYHYFLPTLVGFIFFVGILAGSYPAFFLAAFRPTAVLKGKIHSGIKITVLRNVLVIFQFTLSIILIIGVCVVDSQIKYMLNQDLGFNKENMLVIQNATLLGRRNNQTFKEIVSANSNVVGVSYSWATPGMKFFRDIIASIDQNSSDQDMDQLLVDYDFIETFGIELVKGRDFSREFGTDSSAIILNEQAVKELGWSKDPIGRQIVYSRWKNDNRFTVIGVMKDFHSKSLLFEIKPLAIRLADWGHVVSVRIKAQNIHETISFIEKTWKEFTNNGPFPYSFMDIDIEKLYQSELKTRKIVGIFSLLTVFIGCLGLFGLTLFASERRTKEIGIRKVFGASIPRIVSLLSKEFLNLVLIANVIAWPIGYFVMKRWLQNFAFRIDVGIWTFFLSGGIAIIVALISVSFQSIKAARANPVDSIKYE